QGTATPHGVRGERGADGGMAHPAAALQCQRQVPVKERDPRLETVRETAVDDAVVKVDALGVARPRSISQDAWPTQREALGPEAERGDQRDALGLAMVEIDGVVA